MRNRFTLKFNPWYHLAVLAWVVVGAVLLLVFTRTQLFAAVNAHYSDVGNVLVYALTYMGQAEVIVPVLLGLMLLPAYRNWWYFITAVCCNVPPVLIQQWLKNIYHAPRPLNYYHHAGWIHKLPQWPELLRDSFPSGHSQGAFSFFCFLALLLPPRYRAWGLLYFFMALSVCYSRLYLSAHFFADVYAGSLIGAVTTTVMYGVMVYLAPGFKRK